MEHLKELLEKKWFANTFAICMGVLFFICLSNIPTIAGVIGWIFSLIKPIVLGVIIAYVINPLVNLFEFKAFNFIGNKSLKHTVSVVVSLVLVSCLFVILMVLLVPSIIDSVNSIANSYYIYRESIIEIIEKLGRIFPAFDTTKLEKYLMEGLQTILTFIRRNISTILNASISIGTAIANMVLGIILAIYFLLGKESIINSVSRLHRVSVSEKTYQSQATFFSRCHNILVTYIGYNIVDAIIIGSVNAVIMVIFKMPFVPFVSVIVGVTNLVPTFGPIVGGVVGAFVLFFDSPTASMIFIVITIILQTIDGYILKPRLFGGVLGVSPVMILITIILGGNLFGVVGIILSIPFAAIYTIVYEEAIIPYLQSKKDTRVKNKAERERKKNNGAKVNP